LTKRDIYRAQQVVAAGSGIDELQRAIEDKTVLTIARRQPVAVELRDLVRGAACVQRPRADRRPRSMRERYAHAATRRLSPPRHLAVIASA
jgi:phosphate uptake regulator